MYVFISGSISETRSLTENDFTKIKNISREVLERDYSANLSDVTLLFCGDPCIDLVNIYLANEYGYTIEFHIPCDYDEDNNTFSDDVLMQKYKYFHGSTRIDGLNIVGDYIKVHNPKIVVHKNNDKKYRTIKNMCKHVLYFTDMHDEQFNKSVEIKRNDDSKFKYLSDVWNKSDIIQKEHYNMNAELNNNIHIKYDLITRNLQEILGEREILPILRKRNMNVYWGTAPTGSPSIAYLYPLLKIADLYDAECNITILIADIHAFLDNMKSPLEKIEARSKYYIEILKSILEIYGVDSNRIKFVLGSEYQLSPKYTMDIYKYGNMTTITNAKQAGAEVVKQTDNPLLTSLLYPLLQVLDEEYLNVDMALTGNDQRKINALSRDTIQKLGYKKRIHLMNNIISGLSHCKTNGEMPKMSSSDPSSKIDILDNEKDIKKKINKAWCVEGDIYDNSVLKLIENLVFKILDRFNKSFKINRHEKYGGALEYVNFKELEKDFGNKIIGPEDLKMGFSDFLIELLAPIRKKFNEKNLAELKHIAYD